MTVLYGINKAENYTPKDVRDAITECFFQAHKEQIDLPQADNNDEIRKIFIKEKIKETFTVTDTNYENPSKQDLITVIDALKDFAKHYRNKEVIQKHYTEILSLIEGLPEK